MVGGIVGLGTVRPPAEPDGPPPAATGGTAGNTAQVAAQEAAREADLPTGPGSPTADRAALPPIGPAPAGSAGQVPVPDRQPGSPPDARAHGLSQPLDRTFPPRGTVIGSGEHSDGTRWRLDAWTQADKADPCQQLAFSGHGEAAAGGFCGELPLDVSAMTTGKYRILDGPVLASAATVEVLGAAGRKLASTKVLRHPEFGNAFYVLFVPVADKPLVVEARDASGALVASRGYPASG